LTVVKIVSAMPIKKIIIPVVFICCILDVYK
jgi:hypothetical protein